MINDLIKILERARNCTDALESLKAVYENSFFDEETFQRYYSNDKEARERIGSYLKGEIAKIINIIEKK